jgi:hypothetical protein
MKMQRDNIKVEGHKGTWYIVDELTFNGQKYFLLEHETYGEDANWIAIDSKGKLVLEDITDGTSELSDYLNDKLFLS